MLTNEKELKRKCVSSKVNKRQKKWLELEFSFYFENDWFSRKLLVSIYYGKSSKFKCFAGT